MHILTSEDDGHWTCLDGNDQDYEANKRRRPGEESIKPKHIRHPGSSTTLGGISGLGRA